MAEDKRKTALKSGLRQLTYEQLLRVACFDGQMLLDKFNYDNGKFCPLAIGIGMDRWCRRPSQENVYAILTLAGFKANNTWDVEGEFFTTDRQRDFRIALDEVMQEKLEEKLGPNEFGDPAPVWLSKWRPDGNG